MGKSTLLLQALGRLAAGGTRCLLVTAEESCAQVKLRAERVGALHPDLLVVAETSLPHVLAHADATRPQVLAVDSIQTVVDPDLPGAPGSVTQVRDGAYRLVQQAKEHGARHGARRSRHQGGHARRAARARARRRHRALVRRRPRPLAARPARAEAPLRRHRRGRPVRDDRARAGRRARRRRRASSSTVAPACPGSAVAAVLEGVRPILVEVQALSMTTAAPMPRRSAAGMESGRLAMLLAVLEQHAGVSSTGADVYASVAGGLRVTERGARPRARARGRRCAAVARHHARHRRDRRARPGRRGALGAAARASTGRGGAPRVPPRGRSRRASRAVARIDGLEVVEVASVRDAIGQALIPAG